MLFLITIIAPKGSPDPAAEPLDLALVLSPPKGSSRSGSDRAGLYGLSAKATLVGLMRAAQNLPVRNPSPTAVMSS